MGKCYHAEQVQKGPIPAGKLALLQKQVAGWHKRLPRLAKQIALAQRVLAGHQTRLSEQEIQLTQLRAWQAQLTADNQANPNPPPHIEARMDAGFASGENLAWLMEMGYWPDTKAPNGRTTTVLRAQLPRSPSWQTVGDNAEMVLIGEHGLYGCPYPLSLAVERFKIGRNFKYATLVRYGPAPKLAVWFAHYNARQTIEAGNKEMKTTFHVHTAPATQVRVSHSAAGIRLQVRVYRSGRQRRALVSPLVADLCGRTNADRHPYAQEHQASGPGGGQLGRPRATYQRGARPAVRAGQRFARRDFLPARVCMPFNCLWASIDRCKITSDSTKGRLVAQNLR